jgi:hypothetical protein
VNRTVGAVIVVLMVTMFPGWAVGGPTVFWASEPVDPGDVVLLYGGDLAGVSELEISRLPDAEPGGLPSASQARRASPAGTPAVRVPSIQASDGSLKFVLPASLTPGLFAVNAGGARRLIGLPQVEWIQPTQLVPDLGANEAVPGGAIQIIGRNFGRDESGQARMRVALRGPDGRVVPVPVGAVEKYSVVASLPRTLPPADYSVWVHNGFGGPTGWGGGQTLRVHARAGWPERIFNVREYGARGDNVTDDSPAFRQALEAAKRQGGGVVYLPSGTYRVVGTFQLPNRVVVRGDGQDLTWLKWPLTGPTSTADFIPAALAGSGEYGLEKLSIMVRNAQVALRGGSFGTSSPVQETKNIFLRQVRIQYLPYSGRPKDRVEGDPQWAFARWGIINTGSRDLAVGIRGVQTLEVSDSEFVGSQRFQEIRNGRFTNNRFSNPMGVSWTDLGGQYIVLERNHIDGMSSWRPLNVPLRHIYGAHNTGRNLGRGEREWLTFDVNPDSGMVREGGVQVKPWVGNVASASGRALQFAKADLAPGAYRDFDALIVSGRGAGQFRSVQDNDAQGIHVTRDWDVQPDASSLVLLHRLMGHCIFYRNSAEDVSVLFQLWGSLYDCTFDGNAVKRSQGMWGLGGWFVQWLGNTLDTAVTFHGGVGPSGSTPEGNADYGYLGFTMAGRLTELGRRFEYVRGAVFRGNRLSWGHRVLVMWRYRPKQPPANAIVGRDVVVDGNQITHTPVGIELDANVHGAIVAGNTFVDVREPLRLGAPERVTVLKGTTAKMPEGRP